MPQGNWKSLTLLGSVTILAAALLVDAFVSLAVMMYSVAPANTVAPATVLAVLVGFISSRRSADRRITVFTIGAAIISTYVAASLYGLLVRLLAGGDSGT